MVLDQNGTNLKWSARSQLRLSFEIMQIHGKMAEKIKSEGKKIKSRVVILLVFNFDLGP